ncbi:MAG: hypothetical protein PGN15_09570 [Aeromicrobium erythreum]
MSTLLNPAGPIPHSTVAGRWSRGREKSVCTPRKVMSWRTTSAGSSASICSSARPAGAAGATKACSTP